MFTVSLDGNHGRVSCELSSMGLVLQRALGFLFGWLVGFFSGGVGGVNFGFPDCTFVLWVWLLFFKYRIHHIISTILLFILTNFDSIKYCYHNFN